MMEGMNAHDYAAAFESGAVERLAALVNASNNEVVAIAWRVVRAAAAGGDGGASSSLRRDNHPDNNPNSLQIRKMFINLNSTHGAAFARAFVQHNMVDAAIGLLQNANMKDTVEIGLWCVSEALLSENITHQVEMSVRVDFVVTRNLTRPSCQLRQQGVVLAICNFLPGNIENDK